MPLSATELSMARVRRVVGAEADDGTDVADTVLVVGGEAVEAESVAVAVAVSLLLLEDESAPAGGTGGEEGLSLIHI